MPTKPLRAIRPMFDKNKWKIVRGDLVEVITGKDKGLQGRILKVFRDKRFPRVIVEGRNMVKKHVKAQGNNRGFVVSMEAPLHYSNVMLVDPVTAKPVRCQYKFMEDGTKVRVGRGKHASGTIIPKPEGLNPPPPTVPIIGPKDTVPEQVEEVTYHAGLDLPQHLSVFSQQRTYATSVAYGSYAAMGPLLSRGILDHQHSRYRSRQCTGCSRHVSSPFVAFWRLWCSTRVASAQVNTPSQTNALWRWRDSIGSPAAVTYLL